MDEPPCTARTDRHDRKDAVERFLTPGRAPGTERSAGYGAAGCGDMFRLGIVAAPVAARHEAEEDRHA